MIRAEKVWVEDVASTRRYKIQTLTHADREAA